MRNVRKEAVAQGATTDEAKVAAAAALGVDVTDERVTFEVIKEAQKKTLGLFGGSPAEVKAVLTVKESPAEAAATYLRDILAALGADNAQVDVQEKEEESGCVLSISGEDLGFVIGRRGDTLDALQYLASLIANRQSEDYYRVTVDIGNYREKREQSLTGLARKMGNQVARTGRRMSLEPMNPYERRIIHTAVQGITGVTSWSVGSEPNRYVVIGPTEDNVNRNRHRGGRRPQGESGGAPRGERRDRRRRDEIEPPVHEIRHFVPRSNPLPAADGATPPVRTESETESNATLYGRIDL